MSNFYNYIMLILWGCIDFIILSFIIMYVLRNSKLVIIRGPAGSGKSTIARAVQEKTASAGIPIALLEQDYYRERTILPKKGTRELRNKKMYADAVFLLSEGCHVIIEGSVDANRHRRYIDSLIEQHPHGNSLFYFNLSFEETVRRDMERREVDQERIALLRSWYEEYSSMGYAFEHEIAAGMKKSDIVELVLGASGLSSVIR